jgi:hypothetical protein
MNRVYEGYAIYPNPVYPQKKYFIDLTPESVAGFVFWTRNPGPLMKHLSELDERGFAYYFQYTIVNYPKEIDPRSPLLEDAVSAFCELSSVIGKARVIWRYDPIVIGIEPMDINWHKYNFSQILEKVNGYTEKVIVSIVDPYQKTTRRLGGEKTSKQYDPDACADLLQWMAARASTVGVQVQTCAESTLCIPGIKPGPCVDADLMERISGVKTSKAKHRQRPGCLCDKSIDIGVNNTCGFGCSYCYATVNHDKALENMRHHKYKWACLTGDFEKNE